MFGRHGPRGEVSHAGPARKLDGRQRTQRADYVVEERAKQAWAGGLEGSRGAEDASRSKRAPAA